MVTYSDYLLPLLVALPFVGSIISAVAIAKDWLRLAVLGWWLLAVQSLLAFVWLGVRSWETQQLLERGHLAMTNLYEAAVLMMACLALVGSILLRNYPKLTVFVPPLLFVNGIWLLWLHQIGQGQLMEIVPALRSYWLPLHVGTSFIGYGAFAFSALFAVGVLLKHKWPQLRLPEETTLHQLSERAVLIGFPVFGLAIVLGAAWAYQAWGGYWSWDPKETWALIVWLIYAAYLHARYLPRWTPPRMAWLSLVGFVATLFCYKGVNIFLSGLHSYGQLMQ